jgi:hypothetical protein
LVADHSLKAFGGRLLGTDHGEWGGELFFEDALGNLTKLLDENVQGIVTYQDRVLVFTGLNHMTVSRGDLYEAAQSNGAIRLKHLGYLPGTPSNIVSRADGTVSFLVSGARFTKDGGDVMDCYEVAASGIKHSNRCDPPPPLSSNKSFKPHPPLVASAWWTALGGSWT